MLVQETQKSNCLFPFSAKLPYTAGGTLRRGESVALRVQDPVIALRFAIGAASREKITADRVLFVSELLDFDALSCEAIRCKALSPADIERLQRRLFFSRSIPQADELERFDIVLTDDPKTFRVLKAALSFDSSLVLIVKSFRDRLLVDRRLKVEALEDGYRIEAAR